ncbi:MAG: septum site-determining protein MinC [Desulfatirhabdiaceae bacterium]
MKGPTSEKSTVRLKGVREGLWVTLDPNQPIAVLKADLTKLFTQAKHLALSAHVILDTGHFDVPKGLTDELTRFLQAEFHVESVSPPRHETNEPPSQTVQKYDMSSSWRRQQSDALIIAGRVRSGQKIEAKKHLIVLGDVNPGAEIIAGGDILVLGSLLGTASAGQSDSEDAIVLALRFRPIQVQIGCVIAAGLPESGSKTAEYAHVENGCIIVEEYLTANPFSRFTWPEIR